MAEVVVMGLGYVGLPLALTMAKAGHHVTGVDVDPERVGTVLEGISPVDGVRDEDVQDALAASFAATTDARVIEDCDVVLICVPTGLGPDGLPDLGAVEGAARATGEWITARTLVVLVSTSWPGTTRDVILPAVVHRGLTVGEDVWVAMSPERGSPGEPALAIARTPRVVGGITTACARRAAAFLETFSDRVVVASGAAEAEMSKLLENTFRLVNIALVNELLPACHDLGIDLWDAIDCASSKPYGFMTFQPGPGAGGHCIPVDPVYLAEHVRGTLRRPLRLVETALEANRDAPQYVARRAKDALTADGRSVADARVLLLGASYKPGVGDTRSSAAEAVWLTLAGWGARVTFHDPFVLNWRPDAGGAPERVDDPYEAAREADLTILLQDHREYDVERLRLVAGRLLDTRGALRGRPGVDVL